METLFSSYYTSKSEFLLQLGHPNCILSFRDIGLTDVYTAAEESFQRHPVSYITSDF